MSVEYKKGVKAPKVINPYLIEEHLQIYIAQGKVRGSYKHRENYKYSDRLQDYIYTGTGNRII